MVRVRLACGFVGAAPHRSLPAHLHAEVCPGPGCAWRTGRVVVTSHTPLLLHSHRVVWVHTHLPGLSLCCWGHSSGARALRFIYIVCDACAAAGVVLSCTPTVCAESPSLVGLSALAGAWAAAASTGANLLLVAEWQHLFPPWGQHTQVLLRAACWSAACVRLA